MAWSCTVAEAKARCTIREFYQWQHFYAIEPWGEERADLRSAIIAYTVASIHAKKGAKIRVADFMPQFGRQTEAQTGEEMEAIARAFAARMNASAAARRRQAEGETCQQSSAN